MTRLILLMLFLCLGPAIAAETPADRLAEDAAFAKATISLLAAKDFPAVRDRLDPGIGQASDDTLDRMSNQIGASAPVSIETVMKTETHNVQTGDGVSRITLEYALGGRWVVVDAVVQTKDATKHLARLYFASNKQSLRELNAFHFFGKGPAHYLFLAAWLATIGVTAFAMFVAFRRHAGWRRWALILAMPAGLTPTVALNWVTGHIWVMEASSSAAGQYIPIFAFNYPMVLFSHTGAHAAYFCISAPLLALGYLIWQWTRGQRTRAALSASA